MSSIKDIGSLISLTEAVTLAAEYRSQHAKAPLAGLFGKKVIMEVLNQPLAEGMRIYYGVKPGTTLQQLILVGVDKDGNDIIPGLYGDRSEICPPMCSNPNVMNGL